VCFSAKADLVTGLVVGAIGVDAWLHVDRPPERVLAAIPVVLAGHQLVEALVWRGLKGQFPTALLRPAEFAYLTIAFGVVPVLVPTALGALEPPGEKRRAAWLTATGALVAAALMEAVVRGPVTATIRGHDIGYHVDLRHGGVLVGLYVVATCGSFLVSSHRHIRWFGVVNLVVGALLATLEQFGFISLWCVWAAVTSAGIALHLRFAPRPALPADGSSVAASVAPSGKRRTKRRSPLSTRSALRLIGARMVGHLSPVVQAI
jgi:uncharacterized protein DUF6629